jgi:multiple sugar transport system permease protein
VATAAETAESGRVVPAAPRGLRHSARRARRNWDAYVFLAPGFIIFSVFTLFALLFVIYLTFHEWSIIQPDKPFVGLQNYRDLIEDERFRKSVVNTFYFTGASVPLAMIVGLSIALLLNQPLRGRGLFRTFYYLPAITPFVVSAIIWKWLYNGDFGLFNYYLLKTNLIHEPLLWLSDQNLAMPSVILMTVWTAVGFSMVVYLAGLQSIPEELYEAAKVDGAGPLARLRHITLPGLLPSTVFLLVIQIIFNMQIFTQIFVMTRGGPIDKTTTVLFYVYEAAFQFYEMGYASTIAFALFLMLLVFTGFQLRLYRRAAV